MPDSGQQITGQPRVLVVEDADVERMLRDAGAVVQSCDGVGEAMSMLRDAPFDAVMCHVSAPGDDGERLVQWVTSRSPSVAVLARVGEDLQALKKAFVLAPNVHLFADDADPSAIVDLIADLGPRKGFYGNAIEVELFDYVQMIALTGRDKLVQVSTPRGDGIIWFEHGDIVHAEYDQFRGETAFYKLLSVGRGAFREIVNRPPPMRTVTRSSTHLLMEAARQQDEGILGKVGSGGESEEDAETSFSDLNDGGMKEVEVGASEAEAAPANDTAATPAEGQDRPSTEQRKPAASRPKPPPVVAKPVVKVPLRPMASDDEDADFAALVEDSLTESLKEPSVGQFALEEGAVDEALQTEDSLEHPVDPAESQAAMSTVAGHAIFDDPDMRSVMLEQFWQFEGINGVAIISSTGKVLAEDMRNNSSLVTLAGFYMRGAARIARTLGYNVFDGVVARSVQDQQMVMVSMGAASAVLSVEAGADPEAVRDAVMGVE